MTKASDNIFPKLLILEGTAPASPASGDQALYIDSSSHHLSRKTSAGSVVDLETNQTSSGAATAHGARAKRASGDFSVGNNTYTAVQLDAEDFDTDSIHDNSTNNTRFTIPSISGVTTGLWAMKCCGYTNATSGRTDVKFRVNNTTDIGVDLINGPSGLMGYTLSADYVFSAGDYVECFVRTSGGTFSVIYDAGNSPIFSIAFLGKVT
jgi:hypothetical protein